jgi:xylulokinase
VEIRQVADPIYANARGAAWIGAVGLGEISFADVPGLVQFKRSYEPDDKNRVLYDERFAVFTQIYRQMKNVYKRLNG